MAIKIDLAKAYDRVELGVLLNLLDRLEFGGHLCDLVRVCISSARFSTLINGLPFGFFPSKQGLRQGDPMSPALFTIISDVLSRLLARVEEEGRLNGVKFSYTSPKISCLMYSYDLVIYCQATLEEAAVVADYLRTYCEWTR